MQDLIVIIKVISPTLADYNAVKDRLSIFTGETLGINPAKQTLQQDAINLVNEIKITVQTEL